MREAGTPKAVEQFRIDEDRPREGTVVLALHGEADLHVAGELRDRLSTAIDAGASSLILDLSAVTFVDSMTLGVLVGGTKRIRTAGGQMRLVVPRPEIRRIFEVTLLDQVFPLDATREDALAAARASS
ncbi:MAG TPA: STAS domain-containing protein [Gaiellaceae bacterium]|nr:STAS domain-containing protein [Gaiellaceae bacterium]